jgi:hypothetical protein
MFGFLEKAYEKASSGGLLAESGWRYLPERRSGRIPQSY